MTANNDAVLRVFSATTFKPLIRVEYPWAVNYATMRPESSLAAVVGDDPVTHLTDINRWVEKRGGDIGCSCLCCEGISWTFSKVV